MRCCVRSCINHTKNTAKSRGITYHLFPKDPKQCEAWTIALGMEQWECKEKSVVCSDHFQTDDFYFTKSGLQKVKSNAVPMLDPNFEVDMDAPAVNTCRICLATSTQMYDIHEQDFGQMYEHLTGTCLTEDDRLPQKLCWECAHRLRSGWRLRDKALRSQNILIGVLMTGHCITVRDIKSVDRIQNKLNSTLVSRIWNQIDFSIRVTENGEFVKTENGEYGCHDSNCLESACHDSVEELKVEAEPISMNGAQTPNPSLTDVEIKEECSDSEIFVEQLPNHFESDDDRKLSEVVSEKLQLKKPKKRLKKLRRKKLNSEVKVTKERRREKMPRKREAKCEDEGDPATATEKYKNSDVKRRRTQDALDESLFNITSLTYEEQIAEVEQRQEMNAYKNAPFKCTVCYRGFVIMDRYVAHSVRHTDACGAFECFICKTRLKSSRALRKHLTAQHTEKFSCKGCPFITRNRGVAREHEKWHAGTKYKCPHCPSEFDKITTYMGHIRIKHASDFVCNLCGYTFVSRKGVDVHKKKKHRISDCVAPLEGPFCELCDVRFINEEAHDRHLKLSSRHSHENDPNRIRNDSQSANSNGRITRKVERRPSIHPRDASDKDRRLQPAGPVTCEQCGIQLRDLRLYAQHFRRAHPDKSRTKYPAMKTPCMCEQCGRIFQSMALLKDHMWVHTGEKRFKCDRCDKSFTQKTNLMFHARAHSSARPSYECPLCGKLFAFHNNRRRHMFIHTGLKPFKCDTCGKCFTTAGEQRAHVEHVHLKKPWPKRSRGKAGVNAATGDTWGTMED